MINSRRFLYILLLFLTLTACDTNRIFEEVRDFEDRMWLFSSPERFDFKVDENSYEYNLNLYLRYTNNYSFRNIYLKYELSDSLNTSKILEEVSNIDLFDSKDGRPLGKSGIGDIYEIQVPITTSYKFDSSGPHVLNVRQFMRRDTLSEIVSVGLRLEKAQD